MLQKPLKSSYNILKIKEREKKKRREKERERKGKGRKGMERKEKKKNLYKAVYDLNAAPPLTLSCIFISVQSRHTGFLSVFQKESSFPFVGRSVGPLHYCFSYFSI